VLRQILISIHTFFGLGLAWSAATGSGATGPVVALPMLLVLAVAWGLTAQRRWVIVPGVILGMLAAALFGMLWLERLTWAEAARQQLLLACVVCVGLEVAVVVLGFREFGKDDFPAAD
jgi:hypothetical protein